MSEEYLKEWVDKAEEDYEVAITLIRKRKRPTPNAVCFHCQQCAEKYLRIDGLPIRPTTEMKHTQIIT